MEVLNTSSKHRISFQGRGGQLFGIYFLNVLFLILTLGLYWPWARANMLRFMYGSTEFIGSRFEFTGTGKEMFKGFIKGMGILILLFATYVGALTSGDGIIIVVGLLVFFIGFSLLVPFAIHGALRYRLAKTRWRGIQFGYRGNLKELLGIYIKGFLLTIITFGIYGAWFQVDLREYIFRHIRFGSASFRFTGKGGDLFILFFFGYLATLFTLGIYFPWFVRNLLRFYINNIRVDQNNRESVFSTSLQAADVFVLVIASYFGILFTLGLATPWVLCYTYSTVFRSITIEGDVDFERIEQTEPGFSDATGDDLTDMLDIGLV